MEIVSTLIFTAQVIRSIRHMNIYGVCAKQQNLETTV